MSERPCSACKIEISTHRFVSGGLARPRSRFPAAPIRCDCRPRATARGSEAATSIRTPARWAMVASARRAWSRAGERVDNAFDRVNDQLRLLGRDLMVAATGDDSLPTG